MIRTRMITLEPQFGGGTCPETVQRKKCRIRKCQKNSGGEKRRLKDAREKRRSERTNEEADGEHSPGEQEREIHRIHKIVIGFGFGASSIKHWVLL